MISKLRPEHAALHLVGTEFESSEQGRKLKYELSRVMMPNKVKVTTTCDNTSQGQQQIELYFDYRKYLLWRSKALSSFDLTDVQEVTRSWSSIEEEARRKEFIFGRRGERNEELSVLDRDGSTLESDTQQTTLNGVTERKELGRAYDIEREGWEGNGVFPEQKDEIPEACEVEGLLGNGVFLKEREEVPQTEEIKRSIKKDICQQEKVELSQGENNDVLAENNVCTKEMIQLPKAEENDIRAENDVCLNENAKSENISSQDSVGRKTPELEEPAFPQDESGQDSACV
ncbi:hypothetical protein EGW08_005015 [Elysia chlorotica]|uniref:Uncharacterized protein n=1 Tax=Elysia chlorotica TaxID=188477 RepID=A0A3S1BMI3_ELYCH|nr:hypothetical protein EGW08_005015 [Elysia chlorotica]